MKKILQGEIYFADLNPVKGHEQAGFRPVLVLQNNVLNKNLNTVIIAPLTTNLKAKGFLTTYFLSKKISHLPFDSIALLFQLRTIDNCRLQKKVSLLSHEIMLAIKRQTLLLL
ncbi:type II toxin-antitoxin system PemK/MazF family toxin [Candidatus Peregrinibacteria bacterium]|nr:type II toxin-antitoxin system PemK/MazF family toxin [Candidatus Peregrinibacteria bacterium]